MKVDIKPMSMNAAYSGRRFKTDLYKAYIKECLIKLKSMKIPDGELELHIQVGVSSKGFDIDNCAKPFIDILQKKYGFNDNRIYQLSIYKRIVPKGSEYISFELFECLKNIKGEESSDNIAEALAKEVTK